MCVDFAWKWRLKLTKDAHGYGNILTMYILTGVGFGVARFDYKSNARASKGGMSNRTDSHALLGFFRFSSW